MYNIIEETFSITDKRSKKEFKTQTFSGYKKTEVFSNLEKSILCGNIEKAILWGCELHCSGYFTQLFDRLYKVYLEEVNKSNINLLGIFESEFDKLDTMDKKMFTRNGQYFRNHIHNLICLLTFSTKYKLPKLPKMKEADFDMKNNKARMLTKRIRYIRPFIHKNDPKDIIIPMSEILHNLQRGGQSKSLDNCLFWLAWLLELEKVHHKTTGIVCVKRTVKDIKEKFQQDFSWIIWEIMLSLNQSEHILQILRLFKRNFSRGKKRKKMKLIVYAFMIIINPFPRIDFHKKIISAKDNVVRNKILANINFQYLDVKQNESQSLTSNRSYTTENVASVSSDTPQDGPTVSSVTMIPQTVPSNLPEHHQTPTSNSTPTSTKTMVRLDSSIPDQQYSTAHCHSLHRRSHACQSQASHKTVRFKM